MTEPTRIRTQNLDATSKPVDSGASLGQNQPSSRLKMQNMDLDATEQTKPSKQTEGTPMTKAQKKMLITLGVVAIVAGLGTGFGAFRLQEKSTTTDSPVADQQVAGETVHAGDVFGIKDDKTFKDSAEGYLAAGGTNGEGSHRLLREGGASQTVYLTSSVTDLDKLVGMQVKVWGETFKGQRAGWLMDVGRVQVIELESEAPAGADL